MTAGDRDLLLSVAFDEASPSEVARAERLAAQSAVAADELNRLRAIREALRGGLPLPECQVTRDHLRVAVLSRAVSPTIERRKSFWFFGPAVAVASLGALVWVVASGVLDERPAEFGTISTPGPVAVSTPTGSQKIEELPHIPLTVLAEKRAVSQNASPPSKRVRTTSGRAVAQSAPKATRTVAQEVRASAGGPPIAAMARAAAALLASGTVGASRQAFGAGGSGFAPGPDVAFSRASAHEVVMVSERASPLTGAQMAMPVQEVSDVVFGG